MTKMLVLGLCAVLLTACAREGAGAPATAAPRDPAPSFSQDADLVEEFAGVTLPASTGDLQVGQLEGGIDDLLLARFSVDGGDLDAFVADAGFTGAPEPGRRVFSDDLGVGVPGWDVADAQEVLGHDENVDGFARQVVIDVDDPARPVVYLRAFET